MAREERHLLPPAQVIPAGAVCEHERRPGTVRFVVELDAVDGREGHALSLWRPDTKKNREALLLAVLIPWPGRMSGSLSVAPGPSARQCGRSTRTSECPYRRIIGI